MAIPKRFSEGGTTVSRIEELFLEGHKQLDKLYNNKDVDPYYPKKNIENLREILGDLEAKLDLIEED